PIAYLTLKAVLANIDATLEDSAFSLGARRWRVFATVTLPLATPGVANAFLLVSAASLADFATPLILAGTKFPVLPTQAFLQITALYDMRGGAALCFLLLVPALAIFARQRRWLEQRGGSFVTVTGKASAATRAKRVSRPARAVRGPPRSWPLRRAAAGAHGHRVRPLRLLRLPLQPRRHARHHRGAGADRSRHRRGVGQPGCAGRRHLPPRGAPARASGA